jgi:hypothetical protein
LVGAKAGIETGPLEAITGTVTGEVDGRPVTVLADGWTGCTAAIGVGFVTLWELPSRAFMVS